MTMGDYFASIADELQRQSTRVRANFSTHRPSSGDNRESIVADFLQSHLPAAYGVSTGLVVSSDGVFSNQADVLITDIHTNSPLYSTMPERLWLAESVYAMIEVKTHLNPSDISDAISKCRRFKTLPRNFSPLPAVPRIADSLYTIWAFESPAAETVKDNFVAALVDIPVNEQPDFIVVPDKLLAKAGQYYELAKLGQPGSQHRLQIESNGSTNEVLGKCYEVWDLGHNSLMVWFSWLNTWLTGAGTRTAPVISYIPEGNWGRIL